MRLGFCVDKEIHEELLEDESYEFLIRDEQIEYEKLDNKYILSLDDEDLELTEEEFNDGYISLDEFDF